VLISRPVLYVFLSRDWTPVSSHHFRLELEGATAAHVQVVTDPIRKMLMPFLGQHLRSVRVIPIESRHGRPYISLPSVQSCVWTNYDRGIGPQEGIFVPITPTIVGFDLDFWRRSFQFNLGSGSSTLVETEYIASADAHSWHDVVFGEEVSVSAVRYAAWLDISLDAALVGKTAAAWQALQECLRVRAPTVLEHARILCLEAALARKVLDFGRLGMLQTFLYANAGREVFMAALKPVPHLADTPLAAWIGRIFQSIQEAGEKARLPSVPQFSMPAVGLIKPVGGSVISREENFWAASKLPELRAYLAQNLALPAHKLIMARHKVLERVMLDCLNFLLTRLRTGDLENFAEWQSAWLRLESTAWIALLAEIDARIVRQRGPALRPELPGGLKMLDDFIRGLPPGIAGEEVESRIIAAIEQLRPALAKLGYKDVVDQIAYAIRQAGEMSDEEIEKLLFSWCGSAGHWWEPRYQFFQAMLAKDLLMNVKDEIHGARDSDPRMKIEEIFAKYPPRLLCQDLQGEGEWYLPGLFLVAYVRNYFHFADAPRYVALFERQSGLGFRKCIELFDYPIGTAAQKEAVGL